MKRVTCEMCGNPDLIKQDGVFVCQYCGCKYSVEEVQKMIVEGFVDVTGSTVKVDTSGELANLYQLARRARNSNNIKDAARYYDMILIKGPTSWEAAFYFSYFSSFSSLPYPLINSIDSVCTLVRENVPSEKHFSVVKEIADTVLKTDNFDLICKCGKEIIARFSDNDNIMKVGVSLWKRCAMLKKDVPEEIAYLVDEIGNHDSAYKEKRYKKWEDESKQKELRNDIVTIKKEQFSLAESKKNDLTKGICIMVLGIVLICFMLINGERGLSFIIASTPLLMGLFVLINAKKTKTKIDSKSTSIKAKEEEIQRLSDEITRLTDEIEALSIE